MEIDLDPGTDVAICYVRAEESGKPHLALGMEKAFTVS